MSNFTTKFVDGKPHTTLGPDLDSPQRVPSTGDDPMAVIDDETTELLRQIAARDDRIAKLTGMVEADVEYLKEVVATMAQFKKIMHASNERIVKLNERIVELEAALR